MMEIIQKQLLRVLYEQETVNIYAWHKETCLSPISIANAVLALRKKGLLQLSDNYENVSLTDYGRKWIDINSKDLFTTESDKPWKNVPDEMVSTGDVSFQTLFEISDLENLLDNIDK